jgi:hypothetical protein
MLPAIAARKTVCGEGPRLSNPLLSIKKRQRQNPSSAQAVRSFSAPYHTPGSAGARNREPIGELYRNGVANK